MTLCVNGIFPGELTPDATIAGCIDIFENVWPDPAETIKLAEKECSNSNSGAYWTRAETQDHGVFQNYRTNDLLPVTYLARASNNSLLQNIHNQFYMVLLAATNPYAKKYDIQEQFFHEGYSLLRYRNGEEYKGHYDGGTKINRVTSAILYLNNDYEGGELEFPNFGIKIKPEPGMLVLFPSNYAYRHIAHPVTSGTKYALVTWLRDQPYG